MQAIIVICMYQIRSALSFISTSGLEKLWELALEAKKVWLVVSFDFFVCLKDVSDANFLFRCFASLTLWASLPQAFCTNIRLCWTTNSFSHHSTAIYFK